MRGRAIPLSGPRRFMTDFMHFSARIPSVPVQRRVRVGAVADARAALADRPPWSAIFLKAYARVAAEVPALRRAYVKLPRPHLYEYPTSVASLAVEREHEGEPAVFFARIADPANKPLTDIAARVRALATVPLDREKSFRQMLKFARLPTPVRRAALWLGLNMARSRGNRFGTFGLSVYSALGAESLHPRSPLTTLLNYGVIEGGEVTVRVVYDHRVLDGATVARALARLEEVLNGPVLAELRAMTEPSRAAA